MPHTIPYDPTLTLGNIVDPAKIEQLEQLDLLENQISSIKSEINGLILEKRSLTMTLRELQNMGVEEKTIQGIDKAITAVENSMATAAQKLATTITTISPQIQAVKAKIAGISGSIESPLDWSKVTLKTNLPLAANTFQFDSQYFHYESNNQSSDQFASEIGSYVAQQTHKTHFFSSSTQQSQVSSSAQSQVSSQYQRHSIQGTLVITCSCTHKNAIIIEPMTLNVDKAVRVWNAAIEDGQLKGKHLNTMNQEEMIQIMSGKDDKVALNLLSGATYGSSFVAMIHILNVQETTSSQSMESMSSTIQEQSKRGNYLNYSEGGFGMSSSFSNSLKNMLSTQKVSSHINIICMGLVPSIKANALKFTVQQFSNFSPSDMMNQLATLGNATQSNQQSMAAGAQAARTGAQMVNLQGAKIQSVMSSVSTIDNESNDVFDINSLQNAFEDYVTQAGTGQIGVPINYYLAPITAKDIATLWIRKYYPEAEMAGVNPITNTDDSDSSSSDDSSSGGSDDSSSGGGDDSSGGGDDSGGGDAS